MTYVIIHFSLRKSDQGKFRRPQESWHNIITLETNILNYFVPNEILCQIFSKYLNIKDVSRLDVAICNHKKQKLFLECIGSISCIWLGDKKTKFYCVGMNWLIFRKIKIRHLKCKNIFGRDKNHDCNDVVARLSGFSNYLHSFSIADHYYPTAITDECLIRIYEGCPNMKKLYLDY
jgi:hypothetical protein